ncbi:peptidase U32 family protein [Caldanaerobius polysaccharolyticus]|uniref:peptidase U32 family protein n=1 Tax=Caldanaerobius polysaccharolyticus TaxID=44256 RepID=UPI00047C9385|nr:U32 family peptidase [Caldanaerobius polysaccharolyticus]
MKKSKVELLAPAGDMERLIVAAEYGADAVYFGENRFGLRSGVGFSLEEIRKGIQYLHDKRKKAYITLNIIPHNDDFKGLKEYVLFLRDSGADAVIVSDPGVMVMVKDWAPNMDIHLSTQANTVNLWSALFWYRQGVKRIIMARELSLKEIGYIARNTPEDLEIEAFVHGAMCISYSGRCLLSMYMAGRDANRGECAHPCRWGYALCEQKRPGQYFPIEEDERGTYILNSKDLCMIEHIPEMVEAGIESFKIEGRNKSAYYVATVVGAYRKAIDEYFKDPRTYRFKGQWLEELKKASYREFTTAFYLSKPESSQNYESSNYVRNYDFVGVVIDYDENTKMAVVQQRNRVFKGDRVEIIGPYREYFEQVIEEMYDEEGREIDVAPHPQQVFKIKVEHRVKPYDILRRKKV